MLEPCILAFVITSTKLRMSDVRKTVIIDREMNKINIDITALQETHLASSVVLKEKDYTFFWQGLEPDECRLHRVGFAVRNSLLSSSHLNKEPSVFYLFL
jgi:hypothetical protein